MSFIEGLVGFCGMGAVENCRQVFCRLLQDASSVLYRFVKGDGIPGIPETPRSLD